MKQIKNLIGISFTLIIVLGSQFFGINDYCSRFLSINIKYFAECTPVNRGAQTQRSIVSTTTIRTTTTTPPPPPPSPRAPRTNCLENADRDYSDPRQAIGKHPVSRLFEIQSKNHEPEPVFKDIGQRGQQNKNNIEFHIQLTVKDKTASAWGHTKKEAKRRAAIEILTQMGLQFKADNSNTINNC